MQFSVIGPYFHDNESSQSRTNPEMRSSSNCLRFYYSRRGLRVGSRTRSLTHVCCLVDVQSANGEAFAVILTAQESGEVVEVVVLRGTETSKETIDNDPLYLRRNTNAGQSLG